MSKTNITFELDEDVLANAKAYATRSGASLNKLVAAFFLQLGDRAELPEISPQRKILASLSVGRISLMEASTQLGVQDAGMTLHMLREEGLPLPVLGRSVIKEQAASALDALRECLLPTKNDKSKAGRLLKTIR